MPPLLLLHATVAVDYQDLEYPSTGPDFLTLLAAVVGSGLQICPFLSGFVYMF